MKYFLLAFISALLLSVSWPTYGVPFFILIAFVPLLMMEHGISNFSKIKRRGLVVFVLSYFVFVFWNAVTTGWLYNARNPDGSHAILAVLFPVLVNALLMAVVFQCYHWFKRKKGTYWGLAFFVVIWMSFEKFHLEWEFSWPWLNLGNVFSQYPKIIQWYELFGATGGSFWVLIINVFVFYTVRIWEAGRNKKTLLKNVSFFLVIIGLPMIFSLWRYYQLDEKPVGKVRVMLLQPNLDPYKEKYSKDSLEIVNDFLNLAESSKEKNIDYFITPETSFPGTGSISEAGLKSSLLVSTIQHFLEKNPKSVFVGGVSTYRVYRDEKNKTKTSTYYPNNGIWVDSYNSAIELIPRQNESIYHKSKLVPGVEIFPYLSVLKPLLGNIMLDFGGAVSSLGVDDEVKVFSNPYNKGKVAPIICYESIYGEYVSKYAQKGANFLGIMTNDSWWGETQGYQQLFSYARLRAIENRRSVVRSANSGISAYINFRGDVVQDTFYGDKTALVADVDLYNGQTFYQRTGDLISRMCLFVLGFMLCYCLLENRLKKRK